MRVKCLAQEHNTVSLARARTRTVRSRNERTENVRLREVKNKRTFQTFGSKSDQGRLQEVVAYERFQI